MSPEQQAEILAQLEFEKPPDRAPSTGNDAEGWEPDLNPTQAKIYHDPSFTVLAEGEKGTGKTIGFGHKIVRHCYENLDAFVLVIPPTTYTGSEGVFGDIEKLILPAWRDGNRHSKFMDDGVTPNPLYGELKDNGIGLDFEPAKSDPQTKDRVIFVGNMHGGWSKILLRSIPHPHQVKDRVFGPPPSLVYADELTNTHGPEYYRFPASQLGRRRYISGPQQFLASFNPGGPSHWVYQEFYLPQPGDNEELVYREPESGGLGRGRYCPKVAIYRVNFHENLRFVGKEYIDNLREIFSKDEIERQRLVDGIWVDRPSGDAIFKDQFGEHLHIRGDSRAGKGLCPHPAFPVSIGYDPGPMNFSVHFEQFIPTATGVMMMVFDELNFVGQGGSPNFKVVPEVMRRMIWWHEFVMKQYGKALSFEHIADEAAFTQKRSDGKFDATEIQRISREYVERHKPPVQAIKLLTCPKGADSVPARVRIIQDYLSQELFVVDARCVKTKQMFMNLESEQQKEGKYDDLAAFKPKRSIHIHPFDSMSYPAWYHFVKNTFARGRQGQVKTEVYACGTR